mmetsp:Transcript_26481/g.43349  ORF Transcript_26481/g.43349 Transcript_26481/m.43349 type:complete len:254 (-) Transcript_26481:126-887(-)|eukprot:CAMPEP_0184671984 /NCGR_PEP_ID=MMETSP0308-20130426/85829_1 /TAXON_ID=38269 /ORGANISM="Gloeochaete witrockiana, Strain SAG 46.84" /LENGTH=253 /DNA_ID=CAMNT_0027119221 /DNA_START=1943 /DNA_END=2704 /DNA_ORIENTATION=+
MTESKRPKIESPENNFDQDTFDKLESIQEDIEKLNDKASEDVLEIEKKYNAKRRPLYKRRNEFLAKIPNFWQIAFSNHDMLSDLLDERDKDVLRFLTEVDVEDFDDLKTGYKITFSFDENPYFTNRSLFKEFRYTADGDLTVKPSKIEWKPGKDLTKREDEDEEEDEDEDGKGGHKRDREEKDSFFKWFDADDQEVELGDIIKEDLWPNPVKYFTEVQDDDEEGESDGEEGDEDEDEDVDNDEEDKDEDDDQS